MPREQRRLAAIVSADVAGYSRLMGRDESGTLAALKALRHEIVDPRIKAYRGRIVKTTGDGLLLEFASAVDAVRCVVEIQSAMATHNADVPQDRRIEFRVGVNIGDIIIERRDIFGDGVNVAARLQEIAEPGGVCVSESAHQQVRDKLETAFTDLGEQHVKNIARPVRIYRVALGGTAPAERPPLALPDKPSIAVLPVPHTSPRDQEITFCTTKDGVNLAVACVGEGMPLVSIPTWLTHLEHDWQSPARAQLYHFLADRFRLIRYDARGFGLSDRKVSDISFATFERDLETVVDALGLHSYALLGISQGAATAIAHAVRHSRRVSKMVLHGGFARGRNKRDSSKGFDLKVFVNLIRDGWADQHSALLRMFSTVFLPGASAEQIKWYSDLLRTSTSAENVLANRSVSDDIDVVDLLPKVSVPTLVLHCRHDNAAPFDEGRGIATLIPNAKFVSLESENHVPLPGEPAWSQFIGEIEAFLLRI